MARRRTLAEELAELATPIPTQDTYLDHEELGGGAELVDTDDELLTAAKSRRKAPEQGLRLRGSLDVDSVEYAGRQTTRSEAFADDGSEGSEPPASASIDKVDRSSSAEEDVEANSEGEVAEEGEDDEEVAAQAERRLTGLQAEAPERRKTLPEEPALLQRPRVGGNKSKASAVAAQKRLWERLLELRILLQKSVAASHRLPRPEHTGAVLEVAGHLQDSFSSVAQECGALLEGLLDLVQALEAQNPAILAEDGAGAPRKRTRDEEGAEGARRQTGSGAKWARLENANARLAAYRDASLDRWHRKTLLISGAAGSRQGLKALEQGVSAQVATVMRDVTRLVVRSQLLRAAASKPLCVSGPIASTEEPGEDLVRDPDTYDDGEFYRQLLKEFLEGAGPAGDAVGIPMGLGTKTQRARRERGASKGRKLRYDVQEELVNYLTAVPMNNEGEVTLQLFQNLFGRPAV